MLLGLNRTSVLTKFSSLFLSISLAGVASANIVGSGTQNFNTTANAQDYVTVLSSKTLGQNKIGLGLFLNHAVNTLPYFENDAVRRSYNDSVTAGELSVGYGILDNLDLNIHVPAVFHQYVKDKDSEHGEFVAQGITEVRLGAKANLLRVGPVGLASAVSTNLDTTKDNPYLGDGARPGLNFEIIGDVDLGLLSLAANAGYRLLNTGKQKEEKIGMGENQFISSLAAAVAVAPSTKIIGEIFSSAPSTKIDDDSQRHTTRAESVLGLKHAADSGLVYQVGMGSELRHSVASPDWRLYAGVYWSVGSGFTSAAPERSGRQPTATSYAAGKALPVGKPDQVIVVRDILFQFNSEQLANPQQAVRVLSSFVTSLKDTSSLDKVIIEGHSCSLGTYSYNLALSQKRADKIKEVLVKNFAIPATKIVSIGRGEAAPIADNKTEAGRQQNRRVEFKIYRNQNQIVMEKK